MKKRHISLLLILLLATGLRFYRLAGPSLWSDEGNSVALARLGFAEIARRTAFDIHPPLYYWLLKIWVTMFGFGEAALRSLSAVLGVLVVMVVWLLARTMFDRRVSFAAAFAAAVSPLLVYYSQEARMYMLLTFLSSFAVWLGVRLLQTDPPRTGRLLALAYIATLTAGLYTHYAFPLILAAINLIAFPWFIRGAQFTWRDHQFRTWLVAQAIPLLLYLPWLPIAWRQLTTWPAAPTPAAGGEVLAVICNTLLFGLTWPYSTDLLALGLLLIAVLVPLFLTGRAAQLLPPARRWVVMFPLLLLYLWLGLPMALTALIFSPAFLKFLVVATPALALLLGLAATQLHVQGPRFWPGYVMGMGLMGVVTVTSLLALFHYYTNPVYARDDYRGAARFIRAVSHADDAVILNAEGQQDVFGYYYPAESPAPVYPLPRRRPLDEAATVAELETIAQKSRNIYAVYWAQQQADPAGLIEGWLDSHLYKATDQWYGNVRLVSYAAPQQPPAWQPVDAPVGAEIRLTGVAVDAAPVRPGQIAQVGLQWRTAHPLADEYTVFLQLLDAANHLVGQRDAAPDTPTPAWLVNTPITDTHGIFIEPGTPPGKYRLIGGLYQSQTGQRLPTAAGTDFIELGVIAVERPSPPLPETALRMQHSRRETLLDLQLLGYDLYKLGQRSAPETPLHPGDPLQLGLYWTPLAAAPGVDNRLDLTVVGADGSPIGAAVSFPLAGVDYPPEQWQAGELVRGQYDLFLSGVTPGDYRLRVMVTRATDGQSAQFLTGPFRVE